MKQYEQTNQALKVILDPASRTRLRVNQELQSSTLLVSGLRTAERHAGWEVVGVAPYGNLWSAR